MLLTRIISKLSDRFKSVPDSYDSLIPFFEYRVGIPKVVVQTCPDKDNLPSKILENIDTMVGINPGWDFQLFNDHDIDSFVKEVYGEQVLSYFRRIDDSYGAAKADLFRYLKLYADGGVYLDIKSSATIPLDSVLRPDDSLVLSYWGCQSDNYKRVFYSALPDFLTDGEIAQWYIIASPGHPLLRKVILEVLRRIDHYNPYEDGVGWTGTVCTTGPVVYSTVIASSLINNVSESASCRWVNIFDDFGFKYSVFDRSSDSTFHAKAIKSDYRKGKRPVIKHNNRLIHEINCMYLMLMSKLSSKNK